jgi:hypothetical protein
MQGNENTIPRLNVRDIWTYRKDTAHTFVINNGRKLRMYRIDSSGEHQIVQIEGREFNLNQNFILSGLFRLRQFDMLQKRQVITISGKRRSKTNIEWFQILITSMLSHAPTSFKHCSMLYQRAGQSENKKSEQIILRRITHPVKTIRITGPMRVIELKRRG